jgi:hypothetical protein
MIMQATGFICMYAREAKSAQVFKCHGLRFARNSEPAQALKSLGLWFARARSR